MDSQEARKALIESVIEENKEFNERLVTDGQSIVDNIDALLAVVSEHSRTSCTDKDASNSERGCTRCTLLQIKEADCAYGYKLNLSLEYREIRPTDARDIKVSVTDRY